MLIIFINFFYLLLIAVLSSSIPPKKERCIFADGAMFCQENDSTRVTSSSLPSPPNSTMTSLPTKVIKTLKSKQ